MAMSLFIDFYSKEVYLPHYMSKDSKSLLRCNRLDFLGFFLLKPSEDHT